jgi:hypothetical protein
MVRGVLREVEHVRAVREERRTALSQIQLASVDFAEQCEELRCELSLVARDASDGVEQVGVGEVIDGKSVMHSVVISRAFSTARETTT